MCTKLFFITKYEQIFFGLLKKVLNRKVPVGRLHASLASIGFHVVFDVTHTFIGKVIDFSVFLMFCDSQNTKNINKQNMAYKLDFCPRLCIIHYPSPYWDRISFSSALRALHSH